MLSTVVESTLRLQTLTISCSVQKTDRTVYCDGSRHYLMSFSNWEKVFMAVHRSTIQRRLINQHGDEARAGWRPAAILFRQLRCDESGGTYHSEAQSMHRLQRCGHQCMAITDCQYLRLVAHSTHCVVSRHLAPNRCQTAVPDAHPGCRWIPASGRRCVSGVGRGIQLVDVNRFLQLLAFSRL